MRAIGLEKAAGAGLICLLATLALSSAAVAQGAAAPAAPAPVQATAETQAPVTGPAAAAQAEAAKAPAAPPQPRLLNRAADTPAASTTRYSRRHKSAIGSGGATPAPVAAAAASIPAASAATPGDIVCHAGCKQPGEVIYTPAAAQPTAQTTTAPQAAASDLTCVAGCYNGVTRIAATPGSEASYMTTGARLPQGKAPASGEWMVKINRERGR